MAIADVIHSFRNVITTSQFFSQFWGVFHERIVTIVQAIGPYMMSSTKEGNVNTKDSLLNSYIIKYLSTCIFNFVNNLYTMKGFSIMGKLCQNQDISKIMTAIMVLTCNPESNHIFSITGIDQLDDNLNIAKQNIASVFHKFAKFLLELRAYKDFHELPMFKELMTNSEIIIESLYKFC